ncbi:putative tetratricopeptide-like helical domain superfamily, DYW domain-containing protein [Helianthus annuus]|uniref:Tetratricopeptide-like helical domain superfamily, DYW domain-containing protein n=2 Tax=Helianthus annuus TaxID=4232 RepID=A0A9K3J529_HELAN|nr:pentatricopeptide repeat-containing protein At5g50990 [Helianthus annuus]KAF5808531.1 putative tetratricopeptide-like helical domain superfamily, DYW domain-containing protein [Helianthus annuus]KAJ0579679.1 putative tetratricopeptide-like helical domain superfamily, DYW domain-containing protein [Helianthus annuus]KAJ0586960.1 putative tetratricopeptide-like helical domain superfamily, DYW domain-containing protein [Helianthus annuus]KAJ0595576.1 putative tetratricopeptide-like helical doma
MSREVIKRFQWRNKPTSIWLWRSNHTASVIEFPATEPSAFSDHQLLVQSLEECKLSRNSTAVIATHSRIIKLGYETCPSLTSLLVTAYISFNHLNFARQLLNEVPYWKFNLVSSNSIIASLMKAGDVNIAKKMFAKMPKRDLITWNSMISGFVRNARYDEAFRFFRKMLNSNMEPDKFTFSSIITSCGRVGALDQAKCIHGLLTEKRIELNFILSSALIDMYSKCGRIETAKSIFENVRHDDVSVWNAMINGLAMHGLATDAIATFSKMEDENCLPDSITFVGILTACSHCGLTQQGREYFNLMRTKYAIKPQLEHYGSMVDLFGRAGLLEEAYKVIETMPMDPDVVIWRAFLSACRTHKNPSLGEVAVSKISHLASGDYVLLSNTYCSVNKWDNAENVRHMMRQKRVNKSRGKSWIEFGGVIHQFKSGDVSHSETESIYKILEGLTGRVREEGFIRVTELVLMDISEEEKEGNLNYHSEKLAVAYGILKLSPGSEIRVSKNLRTCIDCHSWMKLVSKVLKRVIIVRDRTRFHRIEDGLCSCGDYW